MAVLDRRASARLSLPAARSGDFLTTALTAVSFGGVLGVFLVTTLAPSVDQVFSMAAVGGLFAAMLVGSFFAWRKLVVVWGAVIALLVLTLAQGVQLDDTEASALFRYITSFVALFFFINAPLAGLRGAIERLALLALLMCAAVSLSRGTVTYAGSTRLSPVWEGLHSTSISVGALVAIVLASSFRMRVKLPAVLLGLSLLIGYGVTTAYIMAGFFLVGFLFEKLGWRRIWLAVVAVLGIALSVLYRNASDGAASTDVLGFGALGSGRLDSWVERLQRFSERSLGGQLIGTGPFSDYTVTALWWWEEKNSHSDIVTLLMEFGVIGLAVVLLTGAVVWKRSSPVAQVAMAAILLGSAGSNALLDRPIPAMFWGIALYAVAQQPPSGGSARAAQNPVSSPISYRPFREGERATVGGTALQKL